MSAYSVAVLRPGCVPPAGLVAEAVTAVPLSAANVDLDYAAYMASPDIIGTHSDGRWPVDGFTLEQDAKEVAVHEADHAAGVAFTFLLGDPHCRQSVGCLYLRPLHPYLDRAGATASTRRAFPDASALVTFWLRQDRQELARPVAAAVSSWLLAEWPLDACVFRILPDEQSSRAALEGLGPRRVALNLPGEHRPYLWFQPGSRT